MQQNELKEKKELGFLRNISWKKRIQEYLRSDNVLNKKVLRMSAKPSGRPKKHKSLDTLNALTELKIGNKKLMNRFTLCQKTFATF